MYLLSEEKNLVFRNDFCIKTQVEKSLKSFKQVKFW